MFNFQYDWTRKVAHIISRCYACIFRKIMPYISLFCPMTYVQVLHTISSIQLELDLSLRKNDENDIFVFLEKMALQNVFIFFNLLVYILIKVMR